jgi:hypothetical protein
MANVSMWIAIVSILAIFNIDKAVDDKGNVVEPSYEYFSGSIRCVTVHSGSPRSLRVCSAPLPFKCSITLRSKEAVALSRGGN